MSPAVVAGQKLRGSGFFYFFRFRGIDDRAAFQKGFGFFRFDIFYFNGGRRGRGGNMGREDSLDNDDDQVQYEGQ